MIKSLKYNEQAKSLNLEISTQDLPIIIEGLETLIDKRIDKFDDKIEKTKMERCNELLDNLYKIAAKDIPKRSL